MAIQEQMDTLRQGADVWNAWRQKHPDEKIGLRRAQLRRAQLSRADLREATLSGANLNRADLRETDLSGANLSYAALSGADLSGADLSYTNLSSARLSYTDLSRAILSKADLNGAIFNGAILNGAILNGAILNGADFSNVSVGWTIFGNLDLRTIKGLETIRHEGPSTIGTDTLSRSHGDIPEVFLRGAGLDNSFIENIHALTNKPIEYYTCFISYSSKDELFARRLHNDLQQEGVRCWFAPEDMNVGDKIKHRIEESIRLYDKLLLILSKHSLASNWVAYEVEQALKKEPEGVPNVLYPVRVDNTILASTEMWARDIKKTRHIGSFEDWTDPQKYQESFKRLLRALNSQKEQEKS